MLNNFLKTQIILSFIDPTLYIINSKKMFKNTYTNTLIALLILFITSCEKSDTPDVENEMEVFTNATIVVTNLSDNSFTTYVFEVEAHDHHDHGGGGVAPSEGDDDHDDHGEHTEIELAASSEYEFAITFQNNTDASNPIDMTEEVIEEKDEHHVFYEFTDSTLTYESTSGDTIDSNGNPLNLVTKWTTTTGAVIDVVAYLFHQPTSKVGTTRSDFGGAVDVEIDFEAHIE